MGELLVEFHIGRFDDDLGTELECFADGGAGFDAVCTGFVTCRRQNAADAPVGVDELLHVVFGGLIGLEKRAHEGAAVLHVQRLASALFGEYLLVSAPADADGSVAKGCIERAFGGDKKTVKIDMDFHDSKCRQKKGGGLKIWQNCIGGAIKSIRTFKNLCCAIYYKK